MLDGYSKSINSILLECERIYGILEGSVETDDIISVVSRLNARLASMSKEEKAQKNDEIGKQAVLLSYLTFTLSYFGLRRTDFSWFKEMGAVSEILLNFTKREGVNSDNIRELNKVITVMTALDKESARARGGLGYRTLRLFLVTVLYGSFANAAIIATFILEQEAVS